MYVPVVSERACEVCAWHHVSSETGPICYYSQLFSANKFCSKIKLVSNVETVENFNVVVICSDWCFKTRGTYLRLILNGFSSLQITLNLVMIIIVHNDKLVIVAVNHSCAIIFKRL